MIKIKRINLKRDSVFKSFLSLRNFREIKIKAQKIKNNEIPRINS